MRGNELDLRGKKFSVLALGNTTFDHFCKCGREFDAALERHGAIRIYPRVDCDVDYEAPAKRWRVGASSNGQTVSIDINAEGELTFRAHLSSHTPFRHHASSKTAFVELNNGKPRITLPFFRV